ncbi:short-chain dehydrogenase/reductase KNAG_0A05520 [Huiozyma naganishii CBS 8797]|uniref:Uncharacterized protein n=1 Tax=Huiozyma naganishii (strain ATCC MYA-139 / BCRC 22969 / CBS 8797 / KCTC 17520 / NBRC 10181 / NCYC 3082 / Yp74L-3) TaxID=1071383 RepID=J7RTW2_HUIN7|nr:hypothetical protein KNAG_0A05520 [Kazachstania naganishii CBS 8797]CCK68217.1 hypothetical protein KNAG_0A05520 [Kazachstania naganishii CBS 8797]
MGLLLDSYFGAFKTPKQRALAPFICKHQKVLITGGSNGLGLCLTKSFSKLLTVEKVIILDLEPPEDTILANEKVCFYFCDITQVEMLKQVQKRIVREHGDISILINNAGITNIKPLLSMDDAEITRILQVNFLGAYMVTQVFLDNLISFGDSTIINICSILGVISPANLTAYCAAKACLISFHKSLKLLMEHSETIHMPRKIKTLLLCPGKIRTKMFEDVSTPSTLFAPDLSPEELSEDIVCAVEGRNREQILSPYYANLVPLFQRLEWPYWRLLKKYSGMNEVTNLN